MNNKLMFYRVSDRYINFIRNIDNTILINTENGRQRPYVGIIFTIGIHQYFAPLSSYKSSKYDKVKNHTIHKITRKNGRHLAVIKLNCMFPIIQTEMEKIDFNFEEARYRNLLMEEYKAVLRDQEEIKNKAMRLYNDVVVKKKPFFVKISSNFSLLEQEYTKFGK